MIIREEPNVELVRALGLKYSNWNRWGPDDQIGTLNFATDNEVREAASSIRSGKRVSLALPFDGAGPQSQGGFGRFNPMHFMIRDGGDIAAGSLVRDFYGGRDRHIRGTDDIVIMPLQAGTQWDALAHIFFDGKMYNGFGPEDVSSFGARINDIAQARDRIAGRGVLLDIARTKGVASLEAGYAITEQDLRDAEAAAGVTVRRGDFVLVRTGQLGERRDNWGDYAGGPAPGLGLECVDWIATREIAGLATDTWGMEVLPNQTPDVFQPLHIILLVHMGLYVGEIFDLEALSADCAEDGQYDFFFSAAPLPFTGAVGSPVNPLAIK